MTLRRRKWFPLQRRDVAMAPNGHVHFHPAGDLYCDDFSTRSLAMQGFFIHELAHVWQAQTKGALYLVLRRHPFCRYSYSLKPGWKLDRYGPEQQAEIVRHAFLLRNGGKVAGVGDARAYDALVAFPGSSVPAG